MRCLLIICLCQLVSGCFSVKEAPANLLQTNGSFDNAGQLNIELGKQAPDFTLPAADGNNARLADLTNETNAILVFYRGYWCPYCKAQLQDYQSLLPKFTQKEVTLVAISPDTVEDMTKFAENFDSRFVFLADSDSAVIREYGLLKDDKLPHPTVIFVDKSGSVLWYYANDKISERPSANQLDQLIDLHF